MPADQLSRTLPRLGLALCFACLGLGHVRAGAIAPVAGLPWSGFEERAFVGRTTYVEGADGRISATSDGSASGLFREQPIDLARTPYLCWSWRADRFPDVLDETVKSGDDFAARVYVVDERGVMGMKTLAINYVWARHEHDADAWRNPYAKRVAMVPVASGPGPWRSEVRNVREDFARLHGESVVELDAVAIMTDSDDSGSSAAAVYGALRFVADGAECSARQEPFTP